MLPFKLVATVVVLLAISLFATGIERIVWLYSGSGLVAVLPRAIYAVEPDVACQRPSVEVKRDPDGVIRYRCGDYWLLSSEGRSVGLTENWKRVQAARAAAPNHHP